MGKKLTNLNRYSSVITNIDEKWFVSFEHTINCFSLGYVRLDLLQLEYYCACFVSFFFLFSFSSAAIYILTAKRTVFKVEDIREDYCVTEIGGARLGDPPQLRPPKS